MMTHLIATSDELLAMSEKKKIGYLNNLYSKYVFNAVFW